MNRFLLLLFFSFLLTACVTQSALLPATQMATYRLKDGNFSGQYWVYPFVTTAHIAIREGRLEKIRVPQLPYCPFGPDKEQFVYELTRRMIEFQAALVDPVEHAEVASYWLMQAVQNALNKAILPFPSSL